MPRIVKEWIGKTDDTPVPPRVRLRVFERFGKRCDGELENGQRCGLPLEGKRWTCDHDKALINGGENRESNLHPLGDDCCNPKKNAADVAAKSESYRTRLAHAGIKRRSRYKPMPGTRASGIKKKMDGSVVDRATGKILRGARR